jgi:O-acetyl-ADP-ribose deacetylase (regulator of RNase III)/uncharacterized protein YwgA
LSSLVTTSANVDVVIGDMFSSGAQTLVNTVNTVGVMGKGVALEFKKRYPHMYADYKQRCARGAVKLGEPYLYRQPGGPHVLNFPTKEHWRSVSRFADILRGLDFLETHYREWGITSLACPPLGCGHGGLEWRVVGPTLYQRLSRLKIHVVLFAPFGTPHAELEPTYLGRSLEDIGTSDEPEHFVPSRINPAWVALVEVLARVERNPYHWPVGRTAFQKLAYFATEAGLPTGLRFIKGSYGPFADGLKQVQSRLVNNSLVQEERRGQMIEYRVGETFPDAVRAYSGELAQWEPIIDRLAALVSRMQTKDAEMAATSHFAAKTLEHEGGRPPTEREVLDAVMEWKRRRQPEWKPEEVATAIRHLALRKWLDVRPTDDLLDELHQHGVPSAGPGARRPKPPQTATLF